MTTKRLGIGCGHGGGSVGGGGKKTTTAHCRLIIIALGDLPSPRWRQEGAKTGTKGGGSLRDRCNMQEEPSLVEDEANTHPWWW